MPRSPRSSIMLAREMPGASSMTMKSWLPTRPASSELTMFWCLSDPMTVASRRNLPIVSDSMPGSSVWESSTILTATGRRVARSLPRQTSPDPPRPSGISSS